MAEMTPEQKRQFRKQEFKRKYSRYWLVYLALIGTAILSALSGFMMPVRADDVAQITVFTIAAGIYYAVGFLSNGEGATYFWFDKLVDHDKDNTTQQIIAGVMLFVAVATVLVTATASASYIAYAVGAFAEFQAVPAWAQKWIVGAIPVFWVIHFSAGMLFKALSDEAASERDANSIIRGVQLQVTKERANARADYWKSHAPTMARQLGELEAQKEIDDMTLKLQATRERGYQKPQEQTQKPLTVSYAADAKAETLEERPNAERGKQE